LIPQSAKQTGESDKASGVLELPLSEIRVNPLQPRKSFDEDRIKALSESIENDGVLQPVVVRQKGGRYELIMGERRLQAARLAGVPTIPAVVRAAEDIDSLRLALVENLQREDLNPIEVAEAYRALIDRFGLSQSELAHLVGKDRSSVANTLRILGLPEEIRTFIAEGRISEGHARALLALSTRSAQISLAERIVRDRLTVRQVETETGVERKKKPKQGSTAPRVKPPHIDALEKAISAHLSTRVSIEEKRGGKGNLVVEFYSHEEFERLMAMMNIPLPR
jgi:ParB family chromosome partitioning protein